MQARMQQSLRTPQYWRYLIWLLVLWFVFIWLRSGQDSQAVDLSYTVFKEQMTQGNVQEITVQGQEITDTFKNPLEVDSGENGRTYQQFSTTMPSFDDPELM